MAENKSNETDPMKDLSAFNEMKKDESVKSKEEGTTKKENEEIEQGSSVDGSDEVEKNIIEEENETKSFRKKPKVDKTKELIEEWQDRSKRQLAEFENFRKRSELEKAARFEMGAKSVIERILPVLDNFERGLEIAPSEGSGKAFADGIQMVHKQLMVELLEIGVKPIEAVGKEFDPNLHHAVMQVDNEELESGIVVEELQKGYMYNNVVVRHSMVAVVS